VARRASLLEIAAGPSSFPNRPFLRIGMIGIASRSRIVVSQRRVSWASSVARQDIATHCPRGGVATGGEFHGRGVGCGRVHRQMDLARPLSDCMAIACRAMIGVGPDPMLARLPCSVAEGPDSGAVDEQVQRPVGAAMGNLDGQGLLPPAQGGKTRNRPVQPRKPEPTGYHPGGLAQGSLKRPLIARQTWTAPSENTAKRPGLPFCGASQIISPGHLLVISLSNQINSDPRLRSEAVSLDQFAARQRAGDGLLTQFVQWHGLTT